MHNRSKVVNKLALVLLSIVVLELICIGDRVEPVKAIKKKILLKKFKKILPLLALIKPKKKLILVPIPIPMFNKHSGYHYPYGSGQHHQMGGMGSMSGTVPQAMTADGSTPMSFIMEPMGLVGGLGPPTSMQLMPMTMTPAGAMMEPSNTVVSSAASPTAQTGGGPMTLMMPSMTMTISSDGGGGTMSAIELGTSSQPQSTMLMSDSSSIGSSSNSSSQSGALMQHSNKRPPPSGFNGGKWTRQQQLLLQDDSIDATEQLRYGPTGESGGGGGGGGGEHYYSSPWASARQPLASPAKLLRNERLRNGSSTTAVSRPRANETNQKYRHAQQPARQRQWQTEPAHGGNNEQQHYRQSKQPQPQQKEQFSAPMPVLIIRNQWQPYKAAPPSAPPPTPPPTPAAGQLQSGKSRRQQQQERTEHHHHHQQQQQQQQQEQVQPALVQHQLSQQQEQQIQQALEYEELIPIGPPQLMPIYQTPNGRLHVTPPSLTTTTGVPTRGAAPPLVEPVTQPSVGSNDISGSFEHDDHEREREAGPGRPGLAASQQDGTSNFGDTSNTEVQTIGGVSNNNNNNNRRGSGAAPVENSGNHLFEGAPSPSSMNQNRPDASQNEDDGRADKLAATTTTLAPPITGRPALPTGYTSRFTMKSSSAKQQQQHQQQSSAEAKRKAEQLSQGGY